MLLWADFPSEQRGLYGKDKTKMLNGIYGAFDTYDTGYINLIEDPDPNTSGIVIEFDNRTNIPNLVRYVRAAGQTDVVAFAGRLWLDNLPSGDWSPNGGPLIVFRTGANADVCAISVMPDGTIEAARTANGGTVLGASDPVISANAWNHIEVRVVRDASAGEIEVRVNGVPNVLDLTGLALGATDIGIISYGQVAINPQPTTVRCRPKFKDVVFWDGTGSEVNDFQGSISVYDLVEDGDESLNWDTSSGLTGFNLIADTAPSNLLTASGAITSGEQVIIGGVYYQFTNGSVDTGAPAGTGGAPWLVAMGASTEAALANLNSAINADGTAGTDYSTAVTEHPTVDAVGSSATGMNVQASDGVTDTIACTETGANLSWAYNLLTFGFSDNLLGGPTDLSYISADDTPPAASIFTMTNLPPDITSVRGLIPIGRMVKTDGGDCSVQMGISPNGTDWDDGTDRAITTAYTYYYDVSTLSPATGAAWTVPEVDDLEFRIDRTL